MGSGSPEHLERLGVSLVFCVQQAQSERATATQPRAGTITRIAIYSLYVEENFQNFGGPIEVTHFQRAHWVAPVFGAGCVKVAWRAQALLAQVAGDVDEVGHHTLRHKAAAVADHAHGLAIACKQSMRSVAHVGPRGGVSGEHPAAGEFVVNQHVDANGSCRVEALDDGHGGDVKSQRRHDGKRLRRRRGAGFDLGAHVFQQLVQLGTAYGP